MGIQKGDIHVLKNLKIASKQAQKANIDKVIALYEDRKIEKFRTAENIILKLLSTRPAVAVKLIEKYDEYKSAKGKTPGTILKPPKVKPIIVEQITRCSVFVFLYVEDAKKQQEEDKVYARVRTYKGLRQLCAPTFELSLPQRGIQRLESLKRELHINLEGTAGNDFWSLVKYLSLNKEFKDMPVVSCGYLKALYIIKIDYPDEAEAEEYIPKQNLSKDTTKSSCYYQYINTELDLTADTLHTALVNKAYTENECWINTLYDNYKDTLLSLKKRKVITRESILQILDKTEDIIKMDYQLTMYFHFSKNLI